MCIRDSAPRVLSPPSLAPSVRSLASPNASHRARSHLSRILSLTSLALPRIHAIASRARVAVSNGFRVVVVDRIVVAVIASRLVSTQKTTRDDANNFFASRSRRDDAPGRSRATR